MTSNNLLSRAAGVVAPTFSAARSGRSRHRYSAAWRITLDPGRLIVFNLAVVVIHLGMLRWIFLPIGG
jgi:hypothetical protein